MGFFSGIGDIFSDIWDTVEDVLEFTGVGYLFGLMTPEMPDMPTIDGSQTYSSNRIGNTISEGVFVSRCYGKCKIGGNKIRFNAADDTDLRVIVGHCIGEVNGITRWEINDIEWSELDGSHTKTEYKGTRTQTPDGRFSVLASAYRSIAYTAFTFAKNDNQIGYNPNVTVVMEGLKCTPLAGGADAFTRNPAVILYDWYLNVEGYSAGDLDLNAFKSLEALCNEVPSGGTAVRYLFDFNIDINMAINDAKKMIWSSFNGLSIMSQGKIKPIWDSGQIADGAGGLTTKTSSHAFDLDNIVKDSFSWKQLDRPNIVRIHFLDSTKQYKKSSVEIKDEADINQNGEILFEETALFVTDAELARRRARYKYNRKRYADYSASFTALSGASDIEVLDLVTITHVLPGWTNKQFIITSRGEDALGRMKFTAEAYYSGAYDDTQVATQIGYASDLPNPFVAEAVTGVTIEEGGFIAGDGSYVPYVTLSFTKPNNSFWFRGQVWTSTDGTNYTYYGNTTTGEGFRIDSAKAKYQELNTLSVKVLSENTNGVVQKITNVSAVTEYIDGKTALPSDITSFSVSQIGDIVLFLASRPESGTDADFSHFELREGVSWEASLLVATYTHTKYLLNGFIAGDKKYMIKAVDTSGNKSETEKTIEITLVTPQIQNIYYSEEKIQRIEQGTVSNISRNYVFGYVYGFFIAGTERMDDSVTDRMNDSAIERMWTPGYDSGYLETEAIDIGAIVTGKIYFDIFSTGYKGTEFKIEYKTSTNGSDYTAYQPFAIGASATLRYVIFKITLTTDRTNYPEHNIKITKILVSVDLPTIKNTGVNETIAAGGTTITFDTAYIVAASIKIKTNVVSATALIPTHELKTITSFKAHVFDTSGNDVGGVIDWEAEGF